MKRPILFALAGLAVGLAVGVRRTRGARHTGLGALDEGFHAAYDQRRTTQARSAPVLVLFGDALVLFNDGRQTEFLATTPSTELLMRAAHVPVGLFVTLQALPTSAEEHLDVATLARLSAMQREIDRAFTEIGPLHAAARSDVETVLDLSRRFATQMLERERSNTTELARFAADLGPLLLRLTDHATQFELESLHAAVEAALLALSAHDRSQLEVVVAGAHQARSRSLPLQYFQKRLDEAPGEEKRIAYAESVAHVLQARALVGTRRLDRSIALAFFGDEKRLQRDVLGDAAARQLERAQFTRLL